MTNNLNEKRSAAVVVAAIICAFAVALGGLTAALTVSIMRRVNNGPDNGTAQRLLIDAAADLNHSVSALRLCNEEEPARELVNTALVFAVRAETALECENGNVYDMREKEAFLNDVATVLHTKAPLESVEAAEKMYEFSKMFYDHVANGSEFSYHGELTESVGDDNGENADVSDEQKTAAIELISSALGTDSAEFIGGFGDRLEFNLERGGKSGYGIVEGERLVEFSFEHSGHGENGEHIDVEEAKRIALDCAEKCGFDGLDVFNVDAKGDYALVLLCRTIDGAMCRDECAAVAVTGGDAVALTAVKCGGDHTVPKVKVDEMQARRAAPNAAGAGILVSRVYGGRERVCYEYRYELDDGVHFVYVCAENGKQMQVK